MEREREWRQRENALKVQIAQLEATLKADLGEKGGILDKLARESGKEANALLRNNHFKVYNRESNLKFCLKLREKCDFFAINIDCVICFYVPGIKSLLNMEENNLGLHRIQWRDVSHVIEVLAWWPAMGMICILTH